MTNLAARIDALAEAWGDSPAVVERTRVTTFEGLAAASARKASELRARGIGPGDAVLVLQPMSADLYALLIALWRLGAVAVFLDVFAGRDRVRRCLELVPLAAVAGSARVRLLRLASPALRRVPLLPAGPASAPPFLGIADVPADAPALVTFTSGSTGLPKAAVRTHAFLAAQHEVLARCLGLAPGQVDLATLPFFALADVASGVTVVVPDADLRRVGSIDAGPVVEQVRRRGVTRLGGSPAFLERIAEECERRGTRLEGVRSVHVGGAPVFPRLLDRLALITPSAEVIAVYGSTEAEPIAMLDASDLTEDDRAATEAGGGILAGRPVPELALSILGFESSAPAAPGEPGDISVSGAHVLTHYLGETVGGQDRLRTGDAGYLDDSGRLWLLGRSSGRIVDGRGELFPFAVEAAAAVPGVRRSALAAVDGRRVLVVEPGSPPVSLEDLERRLAWAGIDEFVRGRVPVDPRHNAKVDYPALRRMLARGRKVPLD